MIPRYPNFCWADLYIVDTKLKNLGHLKDEIRIYTILKKIINAIKNKF